MRAVVKTKPGPGAELQEVPLPDPGLREVLVKIRAAAICGSDLHIYNWNAWAQRIAKRPPMILGHEFCGEVVRIGSEVRGLKEGQLIAGETHIPCGSCFFCRTGKPHICQDMKILGVHTDGVFAEYALIPDACAWVLPDQTVPEIGALYEPLGVAAHALSKVEVSGGKIAVFGCGPIGLGAVLIAAATGASEVMAVETNEKRRRMAAAAGARLVLDPGKEDATTAIMDWTQGLGVDAVVELSGNPQAIRQGLEVLRKSGKMVFVGMPPGDVPVDLVNGVIYKEATLIGVTGREMYSTWYQVASLIESQKVDASFLITHRFNLVDYEKGMSLLNAGEAVKVILEP